MTNTLVLVLFPSVLKISLAPPTVVLYVLPYSPIAVALPSMIPTGTVTGTQSTIFILYFFNQAPVGWCTGWPSRRWPCPFLQASGLM